MRLNLQDEPHWFTFMTYLANDRQAEREIDYLSMYWHDIHGWPIWTDH